MLLDIFLVCSTTGIELYAMTNFFNMNDRNLKFQGKLDNVMLDLQVLLTTHVAHNKFQEIRC
jgi:hypothetical protein